MSPFSSPHPVPFHPPFSITLSATFKDNKCHSKLQSRFPPRNDHPGCWEQAWGQGDSPLESFYANQSSPPEGRAAPAFLLWMPASQIIPHFAGRQIFQGRRGQQVLFCRSQQGTEQVFDGQ